MIPSQPIANSYFLAICRWKDLMTYNIKFITPEEIADITIHSGSVNQPGIAVDTKSKLIKIIGT